MNAAPPGRSLPMFMRLALGLSLLAGGMAEAWAVFLLLPSDSDSPRQLVLRVGSDDSTVNKVTFDVSGEKVSPSPPPVTGQPSADTPPTSPSGGVEVVVRVTNSKWRGTIQLTADSSAGLACIPGSGCGTTIIPFNTISWVSHKKETGTYAGVDIQDGQFAGGASQGLVNYEFGFWNFFNRSAEISNVLVFSYDNSTLYPAGQYLGRVTFTASLL